MRINARLDEDRTRKFEFLAHVTSQGASEVLKRAIDAYYEQMRALHPKPAEILARTGFVGCGEASEDLSTTYKRQVRDIVARKHDHR
ncbi:MAG TPA: CopG family transcriptional regulator [Thermoanaerobaculia bacterium]|jgi:hypothetical protein